MEYHYGTDYNTVTVLSIIHPQVGLSAAGKHGYSGCSKSQRKRPFCGAESEKNRSRTIVTSTIASTMPVKGLYSELEATDEEEEVQKELDSFDKIGMEKSGTGQTEDTSSPMIQSKADLNATNGVISSFRYRSNKDILKGNVSAIWKKNNHIPQIHQEKHPTNSLRTY